MDEQAEYSVLSKAAYDYFNGGEALAQNELGEYGLGTYRIDNGLSDGHAVVITRPNGSAVVSYRGTDHISDLVPDFQIAMGYHQNKMLQRLGAAASHVAADRFADARSAVHKSQGEVRRCDTDGTQPQWSIGIAYCKASRRSIHRLQSRELPVCRTISCRHVLCLRLRIYKIQKPNE